MKKIALILLCITLIGCTARHDEPIKEFAEELDMSSKEDKMVAVSHVIGVIRENNTEYFMGADITGDINVNSIAEFEEITNVHDVYADEIYIDEAEKAAAFMLECYAAGKTPYIIMKNREGIGDELFKAYADVFSEAIGKYQLDVMVEILENSYYYDKDSKKYKYIAEKISEVNGRAQFVWSVRQDDIILIGKYMPEEYVDYICVNGYFQEANTAGRLFSGLKSHLSTDNQVIVRFGASSYSSLDCAYTTEEAAKIIDAVYDGVKSDTGIAGVIYMDKNERLFEGINYTDYSVTSDKKLTERYKGIIERNIAERGADSDN
ncbi:hypothetical protein IMSAG049_01229 [Clostridiales bacterium]|nr:hypothetical protein IMSAG049_01229 [Clostridiales bacterium]